MITCEIADTSRIDIYSDKFSVDIYFTDTNDDKSAIAISRDGAELLLTRLMEALNKIERRV